MSPTNELLLPEYPGSSGLFVNSQIGAEDSGENVAQTKILDHDHRAARAQPVRSDIQRLRDARHGAALRCRLGGGQQPRAAAVRRIPGGAQAHPAAQPIERSSGVVSGRVSR